MQHLYFYFDDSGILHPTNLTGKFVYAGYVFTSAEQMANASRRYRTLVAQLQHKLKRTDELKGCNLKKKHKNKLFNVLKEFDKLAVIVEVNRVYDRIFASPKSVCRFKDYILKRAIKKKVMQLIDDKIISVDDEIWLHINIDEQPTATDGIYGLRASVKEELQDGIINYDYATFHEPLFRNKVHVEVKYWDSRNNGMIQASDVLANRIFVSFKDGMPELREMDHLISLTLP